MPMNGMSRLTAQLGLVGTYLASGVWFDQVLYGDKVPAARPTKFLVLMEAASYQS